MIRISNVRLEPTARGQRLTGELMGRELWYEFPDHVAVEPRAEPFLGFAMLSAMFQGQDISIDASAPVSAEFLQSFDAVQEVFHQWNPVTHHVRVEATVAGPPRRNDGVICSFSAGVDSMHSFIRNREQITHLFALGGLDFGYQQQRTGFDEFLSKMEPLAKDFGKQLIAIDTNARELANGMQVKWAYVHGPILCGLALGLGFQKYIVPASYTYRDLLPWGSHPMIDPMWSTSYTQVVHDGLQFRTQKTENIAANPDVLRHLQVCWNSQVDNCGRCSKCIRTALVFHILGIRDTPIPCPDPLAHLDVCTPKGDESASFVWDVMQLARRRGAKQVETAMRSMLDRYMLERDFANIARVLFSDKLRDRFRKKTWDERAMVVARPSQFK